jgi:signal transduction histidine kinase
MLVGVTTVLLLIMGTVSTYLMARRVDGQLATVGRHLVGIATVLQAQPSSVVGARHTGYAVVEVPVRTGGPLTVQSLTRGTLTDELADAVTQQLHSASLASAESLAVSDNLDLAKARLLGLGCGQFPSVGCGPFDISPSVEVVSRWVPGQTSAGAPIADGRALLLVAEAVGTVRNQVRGFIIAELITGAALIMLLAVGGEWLIGRGLEPLDEMTKTAKDITTRGDLTARMPDSDDQTEVGRLGSSINTMLDRIQQAFSSRLRSEQKVREFAADASHELRTPLTTIRGYAELYRQGALGPDQLPNAMRRIEQEAERMSTLVAELLELARLDRTSSLDLTETDLAGVVRDAVADAIAVEPQRPVRAEAPPRLVAVVDEPRIRQVLANLLGNVRAHTPVHTPVAVRLGAITGGVLIEVADAGQGMSAEDAIRAFDRFHRAADAGAAWESQDHNQDGNVAEAASPLRAGAAGDGCSQDGPDERNGSPGGSARAERTSGAGLGLSIVQAIANAHGGRATLESYPGQGTKVRVWLPVRTVP